MDEFYNKLQRLNAIPQEWIGLSVEEVVAKIKDNPEKVLENVDENNRNEVISCLEINDLMTGLVHLEEAGKDISQYIKDGLTLSLEEYKSILKAPSIPHGLNIEIECKNASEISVQDLEKIDERFTLNAIRFSDKNLNMEQQEPYTVNEYIMCRKKIDELCENIVMPQENDSNREKRIYAQVMLRLAEHIKYDNNHTASCHQLEDELLKLVSIEEESEEDYLKLNEVREKIKNINMITPRNMVGGLLQRECVCAGYAEIVRNTLACVGIEATYIDAFAGKGEGGHAWNQVKLDGQWFNMDLTWARDAIVCRGQIPRFLLMSDKDFASGEHQYCGEVIKLKGHEEFSRNRGEEHECPETFPLEELSRYIDCPPEQGITYKEWISHAHETLHTSQIEEAERTVQNDVRNTERSKEYDKEQRDR